MQRKNKYITRVDSGHKKYWVFRFVQREDWSTPVQVLFTDYNYGSRKKSLDAAVRYRDNYLLENKKLHRLSVNAGCIRHRNASNTSGVIGVSFQINYKLNSQHPFWKASGMRHQKDWRKTFSLQKYGNTGAFKRACRERYKRHGPLSVLVPISKLPCPPGVPWTKYKVFANGKK